MKINAKEENKLDSIIFLPTVALGTIILLFYFIRCHKSNKSLNLSVIVNLFLLSSGVICGLLLMVGSIYEPAKAYLKGIDIYIFIGGLSVFIVSIQSLRKDIFADTENTALTTHSSETPDSSH